MKSTLTNNGPISRCPVGSGEDLDPPTMANVHAPRQRLQLVSQQALFKSSGDGFGAVFGM